MFPAPIAAIIKMLRKKNADPVVEHSSVSRRAEYSICVEMERLNPHNCPVRLFDGDGNSVGPCWYYLKDGKTCQTHGVVK